MTDLRYPIGKFQWVEPESGEQRAKDRERYIQTLSKLPIQMRNAVQGLSPEQLDTPYRPEGWTVRQVVHHVPDSHLHAYARTKMALTEEQPQIKPYDEAAWARLPDNNITPTEVSLQMLAALPTAVSVQNVTQGVSARQLADQSARRHQPRGPARRISWR
jgi:hypothetical protein